MVDYETPDWITEEYYKEVSVNCRIVIGENYVLTCDITLRDNAFDASTNTLLKELETANLRYEALPLPPLSEAGG